LLELAYQLIAPKGLSVLYTLHIQKVITFYISFHR
jgi:hypothetical protein